MHIALIRFLILSLFASQCGKSDNGNPDNSPTGEENKTTICQVASQSGFDYVPSDTLAQTTFHGNWIKTLSADGKIERLQVVVFTYFGGVDSVDYHIGYEGTNVTYNGTRKVYERDNQGNLIMKNVRNVTSSIMLNSDGYAVKYGEATFEYEGKKLVGGKYISDGTELANYSYEYDEHGNLTSMKQNVPGIGFKEVRYEYDYSKEAKQQYYIGIGTWFLNDPSLLEMLGLLPISIKHLRKIHWLNRHWDDTNSDTTYMKLNLSDHVMDANGFLTSFKFTDGSNLSQTISNEISCVKK
jgi:hypothetical protein